MTKRLSLGAVLLAALSLLIPACRAQHSVTLNWTLSIDDIAAACTTTCSQNVYRITGSCPATFPANTAAYANISASAVSFKDTAVTVGQTYCYAVQFSINGLASNFSNTTSAVILPSPPTNLGNTTT